MPTKYDGLIQQPAKFETGRERGLLSNIESVTSSPLRKYIYEKLNKNPDAFGSAWDQVGKDPATSPSGFDIAKKLGATDKPIMDQTQLDDMSGDMSPAEIAASSPFTKISRAQMLGVGADLALDPTNYIPGEALAKAGGMGLGIIKKINSPLLHGTEEAFKLAEMLPSRGGHVGPGAYFTTHEGSARNFGQNIVKASADNHRIIDLTRADNKDLMKVAKELGVDEDVAQRLLAKGENRTADQKFYTLQDAHISKVDPDYKLIGNERAQSLINALQDKGYTGVKYHWNGNPAYNIFDPKTLKAVDE